MYMYIYIFKARQAQQEEFRSSVKQKEQQCVHAETALIKTQNYINFSTHVTQKLCKLYANKCICLSIYIQGLNKEELTTSVTEMREFVPIVFSSNPSLVT